LGQGKVVLIVYIQAMAPNHLNILLADDDIDDCLFFKTVVDSFPLPTVLSYVHDGEQLMKLLKDSTALLPHILFLDLNMPRKNGFECLAEIKHDDKLKALPVVMYSTSSEQDLTDRLYDNGAHHFIRKPSDFLQFKRVVHYSLNLIMQGNNVQRTRNNFILNVENDVIRPETF
jgi:response regulator RpfG family c-di-GMP phosphodiesterase